jgi:hypothetical protein
MERSSFEVLPKPLLFQRLKELNYERLQRASKRKRALEVDGGSYAKRSVAKHARQARRKDSQRSRPYQLNDKDPILLTDLGPHTVSPTLRVASCRQSP